MAELQQELFTGKSTPDGTVAVNARCLVRTQGGHRVVLVAGIVLWQYSSGDGMAEAHAMVSLVEQGWADQRDVARAFGRSSRTLRRLQRRFEAGGLSALARAEGYPAGRPRLPRSREQLVSRLKAAGHSNREIARRVGVSEMAVRKLLARLGWRAPGAEQECLPLAELTANPNLSASPAKTSTAQPGKTVSGDTPVTAKASRGANPNLSAFAQTASGGPLPTSADTDPADRGGDRLLAYLGLLDDAAPLFRAGTRVPRGGVLLALPALIESGVFDIARDVYGSIGPAFYGLRTTVVALLLMALLRLKRPEALKEHSPSDLGRLLGLDRAPEVKTLRRKLTRLAALGRAAEFGRALAKRRVSSRGATLGFLYVDGHVRAYHGKHALPKAHLARMRIAMPATTDYWINDQHGDPLFVVTAEANAGLVTMLPLLLAEVRGLVGERRITVVFDRGGWSPALFQKMVQDGFDVLTYRKGRWRRAPRSTFHVHQAVIEGRKVTYLLADQGIALLGGKLRMRQVTRLSDDGHQTPIVTSRRDLPAIQVAHRMFERWRQENFFKYLREEYALDALADHAVVPDNPTRDVPNPVRRRLDDKIREARAEIASLQAQYGQKAFANPETVRKTMRGFKIAHGKLGQALRAATKRLLALRRRRAAAPARVPVADVVAGEVVKLAPEKKHLSSILKMVAYQAESDLVRLVAPHYRRAEDEGRTLVQSALADSADIEVTEHELRITLAPLSSAHRTRAIAALCQELTAAAVVFPGTRLRLVYAIAGPGEGPKRTV
jgi:transposase